MGLKKQEVEFLIFFTYGKSWNAPALFDSTLVWFLVGTRKYKSQIVDMKEMVLPRHFYLRHQLLID